MLKPDEFYLPGSRISRFGRVPTFTLGHEYEFYKDGVIRYDLTEKTQPEICKKGKSTEKLGKLIEIRARSEDGRPVDPDGDFENRKNVPLTGCFRDLTFEKEQREQREQLDRDAAKDGEDVPSLEKQRLDKKARDQALNEENLRGGRRKSRRLKKRRATRRAKKHTRRSKS